MLKNPADKNSALVETDKEKAEVIVEYFSNVLTNEPLPTQYQPFLTVKCQQNQ